MKKKVLVLEGGKPEVAEFSEISIGVLKNLDLPFRRVIPNSIEDFKNQLESSSEQIIVLEGFPRTIEEAKIFGKFQSKYEFILIERTSSFSDEKTEAHIIYLKKISIEYHRISEILFSIETVINYLTDISKEKR